MKKLAFIILYCTVILGYAQQKYPIEYLPGKTINLKTNQDTLYVVNNGLMKQYMDYWRLLDIANQNNELYVRELNTLKKVIKQKNQFILDKNKEIERLKALNEELEANQRKKPRKKKKDKESEK